MRRFDQINVIPFIDIMLVLLAIVLTTASFIVHGGLEINVPAAEQQAPAQDTGLEIAIDREHNLYIDGEAANLEALRGRLARTAHDTPITLRVDSDARFERFVQVVDLLKAHDLKRVSIRTRRPT